jgi:mRNA interferase RelE/StbE
MKKLRISKSAAKTWAGLDPKQYKQVGRAIIGLLSDSRPHDSEALKGAKSGERRVDSGEYRIIYEDSEDEVTILVVGKRNDDEVYKIWGRK